MEGFAGHAGSRIISALVKLDHAVYSGPIPCIDAEQDALKRHVFVLSRLRGFATSVSSEAEELRQDQKPIFKRFLGFRLYLRLRLGNGLSLFLLKLLCQVSLGINLGRSCNVTPLVIKFLDLGQLLLVPSKFSLKRGLVINLSLLVGIDDFGGQKLLDGLVFILGDQGLGLRCVGLPGS